MYWSLENVPWTNLHDLNLDWIVNTMKETVEQWIAYRIEMNQKYEDFTTQINEDFDAFTAQINAWKGEVESDFADLQQYVQNYFDNLDLNASTRYVINQMIASGEFIEVLNPSIVSTTEAWLANHITPTTPAIDASLSVSGAGADAKVTGDNFNKLFNQLPLNSFDIIRQSGTYTSRPNNGVTFTWNADNTICTVTGTATSLATTYLYSDLHALPFGMENNKTYKVLYSKTDRYPTFEIIFYDSSGTAVLTKLFSNDNTITVPSDAVGMYARLRVSTGNSVNGTCTAPKIINASSNSDLETAINAITPYFESDTPLYEGIGYVTSDEQLVPPVDNVNTLQNNTSVVYGTLYVPENAPPGWAGGTIITLSGRARDFFGGGTVQLAMKKTGELCTRMRWGAGLNSFTDWQQLSRMGDQEEAEMTSLATFYKIGVVGDSFSSGSITHPDMTFNRYIPLSWPQVLGREIGATVTNYTWGGLSTRTWLTDTVHGLQKLLATPPEQMYTLALGINDYNEIIAEDMQLGTIADCHNDYNTNPDTFYGNYGKIIGNIKTHAPDSIIFILSIMRPNNAYKVMMNPAIEEIATHFNICYINCDNDNFFTSSFYINNMANNHPVAITYAGMSKAIQRLEEQYMVNNPSMFREYYGET